MSITKSNGKRRYVQWMELLFATQDLLNLLQRRTTVFVSSADGKGQRNAKMYEKQTYNYLSNSFSLFGLFEGNLHVTKRLLVSMISQLVKIVLNCWEPTLF